MKAGWIKLHRSIDENSMYFSERFTRMAAWIDLLLLANHKQAVVFIRGIEIRLRPGQMCYSQKTLAKRWRWNRKTVSSFLQCLERAEMLDTKTNNVTSVITINKWEFYQGNSYESGHQSGHQNGQQKDTKTDTNKNDKNVNKEKREENDFGITETQKHFASPNKQLLKTESKCGELAETETEVV